MPPYPFRLEPLDEFNVLRDFDITGGGESWYARPQLFFRFTLCQQLAFPTDIRNVYWFFSTHLSLSAWRWTAACRGRVFPCCTLASDLLKYYWPFKFTSVQPEWKMCWVECHWFSDTWMETLAIPYNIGTGGLYLQRLRQIQGQTAEQGAVYSLRTNISKNNSVADAIELW